MREERHPGQAKIECKDITKVFIQKGKQRVHVLDHISLDVKENEFVVILGPGQSGKSTLCASSPVWRPPRKDTS